MPPQQYQQQLRHYSDPNVYHHDHNMNEQQQQQQHTNLISPLSLPSELNGATTDTTMKMNTNTNVCRKDSNNNGNSNSNGGTISSPSTSSCSASATSTLSSSISSTSSSWQEEQIFLDELKDVLTLLKRQEASYNKEERIRNQQCTNTNKHTPIVPPFYDSWRPVMISWMYHVVDTFQLMPIIVSTGIYILDRCAVTVGKDGKQRYPLLTMTALNMAVKCHETKMFPLDQLILLLSNNSSDGKAITPEDICACERHMLHTCEWKLHKPTTHDYLLRFVTVLPTQHTQTSHTQQTQTPQTRDVVLSQAVLYLKHSLLWEHVLHTEAQQPQPQLEHMGESYDAKTPTFFSNCVLAYASFLLAMEDVGPTVLSLEEKQAACYTLLEVGQLSASTLPNLQPAYNWLLKAKSYQQQLEVQQTQRTKRTKKISSPPPPPPLPPALQQQPSPPPPPPVPQAIAGPLIVTALATAAAVVPSITKEQQQQQQQSVLRSSSSTSSMMNNDTDNDNDDTPPPPPHVHQQQAPQPPPSCSVLSASSTSIDMMSCDSSTIIPSQQQQQQQQQQQEKQDNEEDFTFLSFDNDEQRISAPTSSFMSDGSCGTTSYPGEVIFCRSDSSEGCCGDAFEVVVAAATSSTRDTTNDVDNGTIVSDDADDDADEYEYYEHNNDDDDDDDDDEHQDDRSSNSHDDDDDNNNNMSFDNEDVSDIDDDQSMTPSFLPTVFEEQDDDKEEDPPQQQHDEDGRRNSHHNSKKQKHGHVVGRHSSSRVRVVGGDTKVTRTAVLESSSLAHGRRIQFGN